MVDTTVLVLGGGNALGAYHGGVYEALCEADIQPDWIVGASIGAITGALIAGNAPEHRLPRLRRYWELACDRDLSWGVPAWADDWPWGVVPWWRDHENEAHALRSLLAGKPGFFTPRFPGLLTILPALPNDMALLDHRPMAATLRGLVDMDRLQGGAIRLTVGCLDVTTGEEVYFDSTTTPLTWDHLLASTAAMPLFPPIKVGEHLLCDLVHRNNMPLDRPILEKAEGDLLCFASELFAIGGPAPSDMAGTLARCQDLQCASHAQRSLATLRREYDVRRRAGLPGSLTLVHVAHRAPTHEKAGKSLNFSARSIAERWQAGRDDMRGALERWRAQSPTERFTYVTAPTSP
ncbi:patatin-like phospholipase family protein [Nitrospirillum sp. BR 11752]|uniref:patatin-like phospholipase family protein n=1 Tax=Nitrospirillum sp. BR 11752 TaxID=3104293 RepID=UPI002ECCB504|nr:patatin-like phospholipase family protein [Nitrospirillum sp. BR 11752]